MNAGFVPHKKIEYWISSFTIYLDVRYCPPPSTPPIKILVSKWLSQQTASDDIKMELPDTLVVRIGAIPPTPTTRIDHIKKHKRIILTLLEIICIKCTTVSSANIHCSAIIK